MYCQSFKNSLFEYKYVFFWGGDIWIYIYLIFVFFSTIVCCFYNYFGCSVFFLNWINIDQIRSNLTKFDQTWWKPWFWSNLIKFDQVWSISDLLQISFFYENRLNWHKFSTFFRGKGTFLFWCIHIFVGLHMSFFWTVNKFDLRCLHLCTIETMSMATKPMECLFQGNILPTKKKHMYKNAVNCVDFFQTVFMNQMGKEALQKNTILHT